MGKKRGHTSYIRQAAGGDSNGSAKGIYTKVWNFLTVTNNDNKDLIPYAVKDLIIHVFYHAVRDYKASIRSEAVGRKSFADEDHMKFCERYGFLDGMEEVEDFLGSPWCDRLCDELDNITIDDLLTILQ